MTTLTFLVCYQRGQRTQRSNGRLRRLSVHLQGCPRVPSEDRLWACYEKTSDKVSVAVEQAEKSRVPCAISCRTCGGWMVS